MQIVGERHANDSPSSTVLRVDGSDLFWKVEEIGRIVFVSENILAATGFTAEEVYRGGAWFWLGHVPHKGVGTVKQACASILRRDDLFQMDCRTCGMDSGY